VFGLRLSQRTIGAVADDSAVFEEFGTPVADHLSVDCLQGAAVHHGPGRGGHTSGHRHLHTHDASH